VGISAIIRVSEYSGKTTNVKTESNLVSTAETAAVETSEATAGYCEEEGVLSSAAHGKINTLHRHLLLVDRCSITGELEGVRD